MSRKEKKYHFIYKTTNLLSGKYYIGMHSTDNLKDGYMGSGKRLRYSLNKYGKENHKVEILELFDSREKLVEREKEIVSLDEIAKDECMNLKVGGFGGGKIWSPEHQVKLKKGASDWMTKKWEDNEFKEKTINKLKLFTKLNHESGKIKQPNWNGRKHKPETIEKLRGHKKQVGSLNSQYGTMWITNGIENKKIIKTEVVPEGWYIGRGKVN